MNALAFAAAALALGGFAGTVSARGDEGRAAPAAVGGLGSPGRIRFSGVETFTPEAIRRGLSASSQFLVAGHPAADRYILEHPDTGPIGCLVTAALVGRVHPAAGQAFAREGMKRLSADAFQRDCRLLIDGRSGTAQSVKFFLQSLAALSEQEVDALAALFSPQEAHRLRETIAILRRGGAGQQPDALLGSLRELWLKSLKDKIQAELLSLALKLI